jgi:hypothetical protein
MNFLSHFYSSKTSGYFILSSIFFLSCGTMLAQSQWIGTTPSELLPGARPLGSLQGRKYKNQKPAQPVVEAAKVEAVNSNVESIQEVPSPPTPTPPPRDI